MSEALRDGAEDARRTVEAIAPMVSAGITSALYGTSFAVSFGVCFAGIFVGRLIPRASPVAIGAHDGLRAARLAVDSMVPAKSSSKKRPTRGAGRVSKGAVQRTRGEVTATALRITEDTSIAH